MNSTALIILVCIAIYTVLRPRTASGLFGHRRKLAKNRFPAASIGHQESACQAVRTLDGQRYLAWEAPNIPVPQCDAATCNCRYICHEDRRAIGSDRRAEPSDADTGLTPERRGPTMDRRLATAKKVTAEIYRGPWPENTSR
jgi:hypothetical protein